MGTMAESVAHRQVLYLWWQTASQNSPSTVKHIFTFTEYSPFFFFFLHLVQCGMYVRRAWTCAYKIQFIDQDSSFRVVFLNTTVKKCLNYHKKLCWHLKALLLQVVLWLFGRCRKCRWAIFTISLSTCSLTGQTLNGNEWVAFFKK